MSASVELESRTDPVLRRMPSAFWRSLPVLLGIGCALLVPTLVVGVFFGAASPILALVVCVFGAPLLLLGIDRLHTELFELTAERPPWWRRALVAEAIVLPFGVTAALSLIAAVAAEASGAVLFTLAAAAGALATVVLAVVAVVALPLAAARPESSLRAIFMVSFYAVVRSPLPAIATVLVGCALVWIGTSGLPGLTAIAPGLLAALAVSAAWPTVVRAGVAMPPLSPLMPSTRLRFNQSRSQRRRQARSTYVHRSQGAA